jgi:hypothetical protein
VGPAGSKDCAKQPGGVAGKRCRGCTGLGEPCLSSYSLVLGIRNQRKSVLLGKELKKQLNTGRSCSCAAIKDN